MLLDSLLVSLHIFPQHCYTATSLQKERLNQRI